MVCVTLKTMQACAVYNEGLAEEVHTWLATQVEVLVHVVSALFDMNPSMATHMAPPLWRRCVGVLLEVLQILHDSPNIIMDEHFEAGAEERCVP